MDLSSTIEPTSDQLDAVDLLSGPRTFTIEGVSKGNAEQPVNIALAEFPRPWRPGKSMRRVLVAAWGPDASQYVGRRVTLFCDPDVRFGGDRVGGTRISHLSNIAKRVMVPLLISRGKSQIYSVDPLAEAPAPRRAVNAPTPAAVAACTDPAILRGWWKAADKETRAAIEERVAELAADPDPDAPEPTLGDDQ